LDTLTTQLDFWNKPSFVIYYSRNVELRANTAQKILMP